MSPIQVSVKNTDNPRMHVLDLREVALSKPAELATSSSEGIVDIRQHITDLFFEGSGKCFEFSHIAITHH